MKQVSYEYDKQEIMDKPYSRHIIIFDMIQWNALAGDVYLYETERALLTPDAIHDLRKSHRAYRRTIRNLEIFYAILSEIEGNDYSELQNIYRYIPYFLYEEMISGAYSFNAIKKLFVKNDLIELGKMAKKGEEIYLKSHKQSHYFYFPCARSKTTAFRRSALSLT